jgi:beta-lactamase class A
VAAEALLDRVGTPQVNATMAGLGLTQTEIRWSPIAGTGAGTVVAGTTPRRPQGVVAVNLAAPSQYVVPAGDPATATNVTSPGDMARLFQLLLAGTVVSPQASQEMLDLLAQQEINDRLPAALPAGTRVAHKTGNLDDVVHDAGVIYAPRGPVIVAILCDQVEDEAGVDVLMQRIAKAVYDAYS